MNRADVYQGDNREILRLLADNSVDAVVTDPPYALVSIGKRFGGADAVPAQGDVYARASAGFMGRQWDTGETAFAAEFWGEVWRVLKPGGHVLAFSGTRTYHRLACAIEDAGFEIRDMTAWLYGSGFPKSTDAARAIDALDAVETRQGRALMFTAWMREASAAGGLDARQIDFLTGAQMAGHYLAERSQPAIATADAFDVLRPYLGEVPDWVEQLVAQRTVESENLKARKVTGTVAARNFVVSPAQGEDRFDLELDVTAPHTADALIWYGWGTALKPALEPICVARKPLDGTLARNLVTWGVGALNIRACRIAAADDVPAFARHGGVSAGVYGAGLQLSSRTGESTGLGRWPANVVHDGSDEVVAAFPAEAGGASSGGKPTPRFIGTSTPIGGVRSTVAHDDAGSAARFFYSAKADADDRLGSDHPTVKPVDLMAWLVRLVTPAGGVVLDPFAGSGTTGEAALREGCDAILIEREEDHAADIRRRMAWLRGEGGLTDQEKLAAALRKDPATARGEDLPLFGGPAEAVGGGSEGREPQNPRPIRGRKIGPTGLKR